MLPGPSAPAPVAALELRQRTVGSMVAAGRWRIALSRALSIAMTAKAGRAAPKQPFTAEPLLSCANLWSCQAILIA